jgi:hypothetical protein
MAVACYGLITEYCKVHRHPCPWFFNTSDDIDVDAVEVAGADNPLRYRVWAVLGQERLELLTTYARIEEGEEKVARRKVARKVDIACALATAKVKV